MTAIKFCGMTREADLATAVALGVDAVGFVLWPGSPRFVARDRLPALVRTLPESVMAVGVFVNPSADDIAAATDSGIGVLQLHGAAAAESTSSGPPIWIAATLADAGISPAVSDGITVVLDANDPVRHGGTGRTIDWRRASGVAAARRVWLAGGLTPINVGQAIGEVHPYGVDVASGIEDQPGVKNAQAMRAFVAAVRKADR